VLELIDEGKAATGKGTALAKAATHDLKHPGDGTQTGRVGALPTRAAPVGQMPTANFPGTPYGKPGYKESHNWEVGVDYYSPLIFNWKIYGAMYGLKDKTEEQVKKDWVTNGMKADAKYPDCRQGTLTFSPNKYYRANPEVQEATEGNCKKLVDNFLKEGLFAGLKPEDPVAEQRYEARLAEGKLMAMKGNVATKKFLDPRRRKKATFVPIKAGRQPAGSWDSVGEYTVTWWMRGDKGQGGIHRHWGSIFHYGNSNGHRAPGMWMWPSRHRLHVRVAQSNHGNWGCDPGAAINRDTNHWYFVACVISKHSGNKGKLTVYFDGKQVSQCSSSGTTTWWKGHQFWTSDPWYRPMAGEMKDLAQYPGTSLTKEIIEAEESIVRQRDNLK